MCFFTAELAALKGQCRGLLVEIWKAKETYLPMANEKYWPNFLQNGYFSLQKPFLSVRRDYVFANVGRVTLIFEQT